MLDQILLNYLSFENQDLDAEEAQGTGPCETGIKVKVTVLPAKEGPQTVWTTRSKKEGERVSSWSFRGSCPVDVRSTVTEYRTAVWRL